ncbi:hypothetical protein A2U01_0057837 [Trifolium medium]|uniref:Uncharacterized protein n=1 Tax=Trifolium medium TaxID=97028 RepID=A0A392RKN8_9FABA|nr:hypothetical protein [Trifolium medium]
MNGEMMTVRYWPVSIVGSLPPIGSRRKH